MSHHNDDGADGEWVPRGKGAGSRLGRMNPASKKSPDRPPVVTAWHNCVADPSRERLRAMLAQEVTFRSPAVHTPQEGPQITEAYLWAALHVLGPTIDYVHEWYDENSAVLMFTATIDDREVTGVDIITWDDTDRIVDFTVMARPFTGLQALIAAMGAELQKQQG